MFSRLPYIITTNTTSFQIAVLLFIKLMALIFFFLSSCPSAPHAWCLRYQYGLFWYQLAFYYFILFPCFPLHKLFRRLFFCCQNWDNWADLWIICLFSFGDMLSFTLTAFVELMDHGIVSWDTFSVAFIKKVPRYPGSVADGLGCSGEGRESQKCFIAICTETEQCNSYL